MFLAAADVGDFLGEAEVGYFDLLVADRGFGAPEWEPAALLRFRAGELSFSRNGYRVHRAVL